MELTTYAIEAEHQATHWWFAGRRRLFGSEIQSLGLTADARILDVGTSTGTNLTLLNDLGFRRIEGLDNSDQAIAFCRSQGYDNVHKGDACAMPFEEQSFDLVLATDVIEHLDDDELGLREVARVLKPGGHVLISVPAFPALWGLQDRVAHHKRRYHMRPLLQRMREAGLKPKLSYHFNYLLFAPIWLARRAIDLFQFKLQHEAQVNNAFLNRILNAVFAADIKTAPFLKPPFGVSILVLAQREG